MPAKPTAVNEAQKEIGAVLEKLEQKTGGEVKDLGLEDMVDTDPKTGRPVIQKTVEITLEEKQRRGWAT